MSAKKVTNKSLGSKIAIALLLGCLAIAVSWAVTKLTFSRMLHTVHQLSTPNPKLQLVNSIFKDVVQLDQLQRAQALSGKATAYNPFLKESKQLRLRLDSLRLLSEGNETQIARIDSMKTILQQRDKVFLKYLGVRDDFIRNDTLAKQIRSLSEMISEESANVDSSLVTTEQRITRTTIEDVDTVAVQEEKQSFWDRLLNRKKAPEAIKVRQLIQEELNIKIDTLAHARSDSLIQELSNAITIADSGRNSKRSMLVSRQLQLNRSGNQLVSQLMGILQDMESEELVETQQSNMQATRAVNAGLEKMNIILVVFIGGGALLAFLIFADISRSNRYRKELIAAKEEAEELGQIKQRFLSNMSHELRTPLQAIVGMAEQIKMNNHARPQDINIIYHSSQHLLQTVNEVLDYSRIVSDTFVLENKDFNVKQLLDEVVDIMRLKLDSKGLQLVYDTQVDAQTNHTGDPFRLKQILYNLLGNAIKFTDKGTITLKVIQDNTDAQSRFTLTITDTGTGISSKDMERIFNQFEQGSNPLHRQQGTGLGLSIVKALVDAQKGTIDVESEMGQGTVFTVVLSYPISATVSHNRAAELPKAPFTGKVLIVDDDAFILQLCSTILSKYNIRHACYQSPIEALQKVNADTTLALLDIRMPQMNGIALCKELKNILPVSTRYVALTAQVLPDEKDNILSGGFDSILMKPFMEKDLVGMVYVNARDIPPAEVNTDETVEKDILQSYVAETSKDLTALRYAIYNNKPADAAEYLHRLAGRCSQMGDLGYSYRLRTMEQAIRKAGNWTDTGALIQLCEEVNDIIVINQRELSRFD